MSYSQFRDAERLPEVIRLRVESQVLHERWTDRDTLMVGIAKFGLIGQGFGGLAGVIILLLALGANDDTRDFWWIVFAVLVALVMTINWLVRVAANQTRKLNLADRADIALIDEKIEAEEYHLQRQMDLLDELASLPAMAYSSFRQAAQKIRDGVWSIATVPYDPEALVGRRAPRIIEDEQEILDGPQEDIVITNISDGRVLIRGKRSAL